MLQQKKSKPKPSCTIKCVDLQTETVIKITVNSSQCYCPVIRGRSPPVMVVFATPVPVKPQKLPADAPINPSLLLLFRPVYDPPSQPQLC